MPQSTILPPVAAKPAEVAAPVAPDPQSGGVDAADGSGGPTFDQVLKSQMDKGQPDGGEAKQDPAAATAMDAATAAVILAQLDQSDGRQAATGLLQAMIGTRTEKASAAQSHTEGEAVLSAIATRVKASTDTATSQVIKAAAEGVERAGEDADASSFRTLIEAEESAVRTARRAGPDESFEVPEIKALDKSARSRVESTPLVAVAPTESRAASESAPLRLTVSQPVGTTGWDEAVADRITWLAQARQPTAELQLNPPNLGPVEVRVTMTGDQASVSFFSPHAPVREALQGSMPRLTEAFAASGLSLGDVFVGADGRSGQQQGRGQERRERADEAANERIGAVGLTGARWSSALGGVRAVDLFA